MKTTTTVLWLTTILAAAALLPSRARAEEAVCVRVKLEIPQRLSFERDAFDATLVLTNNLVDAPLEQLGVEVQFTDLAGHRVDELFFLAEPSLTGVSGGIRGGGLIAAEQRADIHWLIVPTPGAGGIFPGGIQYKVKAIIDYAVQGVPASIETYDEIITVKPQPELVLDYFLPRRVQGDDPFTEGVVEPSVPFDLAVRVANIGHGEARNLRIVSGQPRIVENQWGLLIDFAIIGTFRNDNTIQNTMAIPFGTLGPAQCGVGAWAMTTSLQGRFVELDVSFEHSEELGGAKTSLVSATRSHWLVHRVQVDTPGKDAVSDLLAEVDLDSDGTSDALRIFESQCGDIVAWPAPGTAAGNPSLSDPTAVVTSTLDLGWNHVTAEDPAAGTLPILRVVRQSDGKILHWRNSWLDEDTTGTPLLALVDLSPSSPRIESWLVNYDMSEFDQVAPVTSLRFAGPHVAGDPLHLAPVTVMTLQASDDLSGVASSEYRLDSGAWTPNSPFYFQVEGAHLIEFRSTDRKGNVEAVQVVPVIVDGTAPTIAITTPQAGHGYLRSEPLTVAFDVADLDPEPVVVAHIAADAGGDPVVVSSGQVLDLTSWIQGSYTLTVTATDWLGNLRRSAVSFLVQSQVGGCVNVPDRQPCDDGNPCTVGETCGTGGCGNGTANACDDGNLCTNDSCVDGVGCQHGPNVRSCDDGNACTTDDTCDQGQCGGQVVVCDDQNPCTDDSCSVQTGCGYTPNSLACDDGNACTTGDLCLDRECRPGAATEQGTPCTDHDACTGPDECDGAGTCAGIARSCADGNACTSDLCDSVQGCSNPPVSGGCDDGNACTAQDSCSGGQCAGQALAAGSACDDGNPCTGPDLCTAVPRCEGALVVCDDSSACDPTTCCGDSAVDCDDQDACTVDWCAATGSACRHLPHPSCVQDAGPAVDAATVIDATAGDAGVATDDAMAADGAPDAASGDATPDAGAVDGAVADSARPDGARPDAAGHDALVTGDATIVDGATTRRDTGTAPPSPPDDGCVCAGATTPSPWLALVLGLLTSLRRWRRVGVPRRR